MSFVSTVGVILHTLRHAAADRVRRAWRRAAHRERTLRVGVDIRSFYEPLTGIGWYLYFVLHELAKHDGVELFLFGDARVTDYGPELHADLPANARLCTFDLRGQPWREVLRPMTAAAYVAWMELSGCDVFFAPNYFLPRLHGSVARRRVITIHDLTYKRFPELLQKETLENLELQMGREIAIADAIVCVSESTRRDLLEFYRVDPARAVTIHSGLAAPPPEAAVDGLPARYVLFVSTIEPRKDLGTLIDAFERLRDSGGYDGSLVVVGKIGWKAESTRARLRGRGIVHLDYLRYAQLGTVYRNAEVFVFPSIYEGFGFPLLEAMAHGVPSIAARSSSLPEIGADAALYFEPRDVDGLEAQLRRVLSDAALREELAARGRTRAAEFSWERAGAQTLEVLRRAAS
ncbi:MAG TPA: glycosyltransferase family 1 protein [Thermoanaerobaculia bacterium]|nr:glycosyltransferase family 1 protein [Thermoanaerobaculia bacterium]